MTTRQSRSTVAVCLSTALGVLACGGDEGAEKAGTESGSGSGGGAPHHGTEHGDHGTTHGGQKDVDTALKKVPRLLNVASSTTGDNVKITFEPVDGAKDYRVYALPADEDVTNAPDGHVTVRDATYRCAGNRMAAEADLYDDGEFANQSVRTIVKNAPVGGYTRTEDEATLGYVFATPGPDRIAVHALGDPDADADSGCYRWRWRETRTKKYVTSESEYESMVSAGWRDDGIAFYAPKEASGSTATVYLAESDHERFYFTDGPEAGARGSKQAAFQALKEAQSEATPLMRVYYEVYCGMSHDELVAGKARFERAYKQGDQLPMFEVHWAGFTEKTTLVVEALDELCPYPAGMIAPVTSPTAAEAPWVTLADARANSPSGEVFINGQGDAANAPKPIRRSFVEVEPSPIAGLDWFEGFDPGTELGPFQEKPCEDLGNPQCWAETRLVSSEGQLLMAFNEEGTEGFASSLGEFWVGIGDMGGGAKFRYQPNETAELTDDSFLYLTMHVDSYTTGRRYPQIILTEPSISPLPIDKNMTAGKSIIIQPFIPPGAGTWPNVLTLEVCEEGRMDGWDVNNQCPMYADFRKVLDPDNPMIDEAIRLAPIDEVAEHAAGLDQTMRIEAYVSTRRAYLFLDGKPHGCMILPTSGVLEGTVRVAFGDVIYHAVVEENEVPAFFKSSGYAYQSIRKFDNLGWKSGTTGPKWDEKLLPCMAPAVLHQ